MIGTDVIHNERERRLAKLDALRARGVDPYPSTFARDHDLAEVRAEHAGLGAGARTTADVRVAGRVQLLRRHGGLVFITLADQSGSLQLLAARDRLGEDAFATVAALDRGDWVGAAGTVITTRTGELTVDAGELQLLSKALRALPDKHHGLLDTETRLRERHLDLIGNPRTRRTFDIRSRVIAEVRRTLGERGFTEVETPVLEAEAGGAAARSFVTHHNALGTDRHLRIALELPLKRLVVGGYERVFELGRVFRNEGIDATHNPEFTLLEAYQSLADYRDMMELVETIVSRAAVAANGSTLVEVDGTLVDLAPPWRRATMHELIFEATGERMHPHMPVGAAQGLCDELGIAYKGEWGAGKLMCEVFEAGVEHSLIAPTFVLDHPRETSPLARAHRDEPAYTERFEAIVGGRELANAYSELNDPVDQRERFAAQGAVDEDYVRALEYGLPPTGGLGIGIDRLVMLIAEVPTIRDVVLFPAMKPRSRPQRPARNASLEPEFEPAEVRPRPRAPRVLGALSALVGLLLLFANVFHDQAAHDVRMVAGHVVTVVAGVGLLVVARQLRRGKRRAWAVASTLFATAALGALLRGPDPVAVLITVAMLLALVWHRDAFAARPDPGSRLDIARFLVRYGVGVTVFGTGTLLLDHDHVSERLTAGGILETITLGLAGLSGPYHYTGRFLDAFFPATLLALGLAGLLLLSVLAFRAVRSTGMPDADERERAQALVLAHGSGTLDYFALRDDKRYFFAADGDAFLAYGFLGGTALVSGDPIGSAAARDRVVGEFLELCRLRGWQVAFLGARERDLPLYRRHGLRGVYLGDEAVVQCDRFSLAAGHKSVRSAVARVGRECTFELLRETEASPALRAQLNALRERWLGEEDERGFTMELGGGVRGDDPRLLLAVAYATDGRPLGFLRLVPCFGDDEGWSLDLMQHDPQAPNGMTEYLIAMCATELGARGFRRLSLNFATWGRLFAEGAKLNPAQRVQRRVGQALSPHFQITSLRDFNAKFDPQWVPRTIVVEDLASIPRVGLLYAAFEGFVRLPSPFRHTDKRNRDR